MSHWEAAAVTLAAVAAIFTTLDMLWQRHKRSVQVAGEQSRDAAIHEVVRESIGDLRDALTGQVRECATSVQEVKEKLIRLETDQFGSNHGGIRQQVNDIDAKVDGLAVQVGELRGAIQARGLHLIEGV